MRRRDFLGVVAGVAVVWPAACLASPADDAASIIDQWAAAYSSNDVEALLKVYAPDAILQGTNEPQINVGREALRKYFRDLPNSGKKVTIQERRMVTLNDTTVMAIGFYKFKNPSRFSFVVVKRGNDWMISHHHSSLVPAGRP